MVNLKRAFAATGVALLLLAANEAPFGSDVSRWLASDPHFEVELVAPEIIEDETIIAAAVVEEPEIRVRPDTLAALVAEMRSEADAAQFDRDAECLARSIYWEAKGETLEGQLAVAEVILNRVDDRRFGHTVCAVVKAPGQFSFVRGGEIPQPRHRAAYATARAVALIAMEEHWSPVVGDATHFHARYVNPGWRLKRVAQVGNHIFYR